MTKLVLTTELLCSAAKKFSRLECPISNPALFGVTDGKAVGTFLEHRFRDYLSDLYEFDQGNSAFGIDFPSINVDMKTTSIRQPQSSCPYKSARQKIYGLGYGIILFVYDKLDDQNTRCATLEITDTVFIEACRTADFQMTKGLRHIVENSGNKDDLMAFMAERNLPVDEIELEKIADDILCNKPYQGYLTISNALQWRLQYRRVIEMAGDESGIISIYKS